MAIKKEYLYAGIAAIAGIGIGYVIKSQTAVSMRMRTKGCSTCGAGSMNIDSARRSMNID